jgi:hypothetical protein
MVVQADMTALNQNPEQAISLGVLKISGPQILKEKALAGASEAGETEAIVPTRNSIRFNMIMKMIENENKDVAYLKNDPVFHELYLKDKYEHLRSSGLLSQESPDYKINKNFLSLTKVNAGRRKEALMFVFLMDKVKNEDQDAQNEEPKKSIFKKLNPRNHMHVMWTGPKRMMKEQQFIENQYPIDFSVARYDEGYSNEELNVVLPSRKPREIAVSLLWSF